MLLALTNSFLRCLNSTLSILYPLSSFQQRIHNQFPMHPTFPLPFFPNCSTVGFVDFATLQAATKALETYNDYKFPESDAGIQITFSRGGTKRSRPRMPGGGGGGGGAVSKIDCKQKSIRTNNRKKNNNSPIILLSIKKNSTNKIFAR